MSFDGLHHLTFCKSVFLHLTEKLIVFINFYTVRFYGKPTFFGKPIVLKQITAKIPIKIPQTHRFNQQNPCSIYHIINIFTIFALLNDMLSMAKNTMGTNLPRKLEKKMAIMGEQIKLARLRRNLSIAQVAERATCSPLTINRIEKGSPTVSIGIYARVLYALQLDDDILLLAKEDTLGRTLQDLSLKHRQRASKKE